ncbi:hypothetical protein BDK51DRAFT_21716, partial [Blyttiomyces helicus]
SEKISVSNMLKTITQNDITELFSGVGPVVSAQLNYDSAGKSKGTATVIFRRAGDANRAIAEFHNRTLDQKPMKIERILSLEASQLAAAALGVKSHDGAGGRRPHGGAGAPVSGGRRGGAGGRRSGRGPRKPVTADDLDREMDAYMKDEVRVSSVSPPLIIPFAFPFH